MANEQQQALKTTTKETFNALETMQQVEHSAVMVATAARAEIESALILAKKFPRNQEQARIELLNACKRLKFAEKAKYRKPVGKKLNEETKKWEQTYAEGPSIRFAEEAIRAWGNIKIQHATIYEDDMKRISQLRVIDLEKNTTYGRQMVINKFIERKNPVGREIISERVNSRNETTYLVKATDDEVTQKEAIQLSKEIRNLALRQIPQDIIDEGMETVEDIILKGVSEDPAAAKRKIFDSFNEIGIKPEEIEKYVGHQLDILTSAELVDLRKVFTSIKDGNSTWHEYISKENVESNEETAGLMPKEKGSVTAKESKEPVGIVDYTQVNKATWNLLLEICSGDITATKAKLKEMAGATAYDKIPDNKAQEVHDKVKKEHDSVGKGDTLV